MTYHLLLDKNTEVLAGSNMKVDFLVVECANDTTKFVVELAIA